MKPEDSGFTYDKLPPSLAAAKDKLTVSELYVVGINRNSADGGSNAIALFKKLAKDPKLADFFDFSKAKTDDELLKGYIKNTLENTEALSGYPFHMRLPLKRTMEVKVPTGNRPN